MGVSVICSYEKVHRYTTCTTEERQKQGAAKAENHRSYSCMRHILYSPIKSRPLKKQHCPLSPEIQILGEFFI